VIFGPSHNQASIYQPTFFPFSNQAKNAQRNETRIWLSKQLSFGSFKLRHSKDQTSDQLFTNQFSVLNTVQKRSVLVDGIQRASDDAIFNAASTKTT
jgi:hypothetical protein